MAWSSSQINFLIQEYEKYPCLYVVKDKDYHNKNKRAACLAAISQVLPNTLRPNTSEAEIVKKFNGLRTTYTTERRKVLDSMKSGRGSDEVYTPSLWYFEQLHFLQDQIQVRSSKSNLSISEDTETASMTEYEVIEDGLLQQMETEEDPILLPSSNEEIHPKQTQEATTKTTPSGRKRKISETDVHTSTLSQASECLRSISSVFQNKRQEGQEKTDDDIYGEYVARRLKNIKDQRKKLDIKHKIDNLLYEAAVD